MAIRRRECHVRVTTFALHNGTAKHRGEKGGGSGPRFSRRSDTFSASVGRFRDVGDG
jgi:hypothetical protein